MQTFESVKPKSQTSRVDGQRHSIPVATAVVRPNNGSIDERVQPNLVVRALDVQGKELFCSFLFANFPAQFASCGGRVDVNWVQYARQPVLDAPKALTWAFRSIATLHTGGCYHDSEMITSSRHMYSRSLRYLSDLISHPRYARGAETLATAILLNIYEMHDGVTSLSWLAHARGLSSLISLRGPDAHRTGISLTLLRSCRALLVAEAFLSGRSCFLERLEWQEFLTKMVEDEAKSGDGSQLGILVDSAFTEVSRCPGFLVKTREVIEDSHESFPSRKISSLALIQRMVRSRDTLYAIQAQLEVGLCRQQSPNPVAPWEAFVGPISLDSAGAFAQSVLNAISLSIALLNHLLNLVRLHLDEGVRDDSASSSSASATPQPFAVNPWSDLGSHPGSWQLQFNPNRPLGSFYTTRETPGWMDRMVMSMGLFGIRPREHSEYQ